MAPLRVGIVGLSASPGGSGWAKQAHLPYLQASPDFEIAGVVNSTLDSSKEAINAFQLSETAKPFIDIEDMASEESIDLIVVCVEVRKHAEIVRVAMKFGMQIFCEWPLAKDLEEGEQLHQYAKRKRIQTYVGLEGRLSPVVLKLREIISSSTIGKVYTTTINGTLGALPTVWSEKALFYLDISSGQSPLHTRVGHLLDAVCNTVGEFKAYVSGVATHAKRVDIYNVPVSKLAEASADLSAAPRVVKRTAPDDVSIQGRLEGDVYCTFHVRSGIPDAYGNILIWTITGTEGLIQVTQKRGQFLRDTSVQVQVVKGEQVEDIKIDWEISAGGNVLDLNPVFATPSRIYQAIADGNEAVVGFEQAYKRHELLDSIILGRSFESLF